MRNDLVASIAQFTDEQFINPAVAAAANLRPGSITNGAPVIPSTGKTVAAVMDDLQAALLALMNATAGSVTAATWIMSPTAALFLATLRTAQDVFAFPGMSLGGAPGALGPTPTLLGLPVVVSANVPLAAGLSDIVLLDQPQLLLADDGQTLVDTSSEASVQMNDAPATPPTPFVSFWQQNLLGIKAERFIYCSVVARAPSSGSATSRRREYEAGDRRRHRVGRSLQEPRHARDDEAQGRNRARR